MYCWADPQQYPQEEPYLWANVENLSVGYSVSKARRSAELLIMPRPVLAEMQLPVYKNDRALAS